MESRQPDSSFGQSVEIGCVYLPTKSTYIRPSQIIRDNNKEIGPLWRCIVVLCHDELLLFVALRRLNQEKHYLVIHSLYIAPKLIIADSANIDRWGNQLSHAKDKVQLMAASVAHAGLAIA